MLRRLPVDVPSDHSAPDNSAPDHPGMFDSGMVDSGMVDGDLITTLIAAEPRGALPDRPWMMVNMVTSVDGATAVNGVSGPLGGDGDQMVFRALRSIADVVLVGSGTVTAERYRPVTATAEHRQQRAARGQSPAARLAVVSNGGTIDLSLPCFTDSDPTTPPIVFVAADVVDPARRRQLEAVAEVVEAGLAVVDLHRAVSHLRQDLGADIVLCEGGPHLNGLLVTADLIDEWCITISPMLAGGDSTRAAVGPAPPGPHPLRLARAWLADEELLLRYVRSDSTRDGPPQR